MSQFLSSSPFPFSEASRITFLPTNYSFFVRHTSLILVIITEHFLSTVYHRGLRPFLSHPTPVSF